MYDCHAQVVDLSRWLPEKKSDGKALETPIEREETLFLTLLNDFGLYLGPLMILYHHPIPGFFRLTITTSRDCLDIGLCRLEKFVKGSS